MWRSQTSGDGYKACEGLGTAVNRYEEVKDFYDF